MEVTPLVIDIIIHLNRRSVCFQENECSQFNSDAGLDVLSYFEKEGLANYYKEKEKNYAYWGVTEKGKKWVQMICATPLPVQEWIDPRSQNDC